MTTFSGGRSFFFFFFTLAFLPVMTSENILLSSFCQISLSSLKGKRKKGNNGWQDDLFVVKAFLYE